MITKYIEQALERARYEKLEDGSYCASVRGLRGVVAVGRTVKSCRAQLAEMVEEWILVRVSRGLAVPRLGGISVRVRRAG
jgi:predicted RNase H-like HicB family nuclease